MLFLNNKAISVLVVFSLLMVFSGCLKKEVKNNKKPASEVLLASVCGMDKLPCCQDEPACAYSQKCCVDPNSPTRNYCSDQCSCGAKGEFCCQGGDKCQNGLACLDGNCAECGADEQICCADNQCGEGLVCDSGKCTRCGVEGNICCAGDICLTRDENNKTRTECVNGSCVQCGFGDRACSGDTKCVPGNLYSNGACFECGEANQPCCGQASGRAYECDPKKYLTCYQGFCLE